MSDDSQEKQGLLSNIKQKVDSFMKNQQENARIRQENEMKYWGGRLGRTFTTYPEMCGARDERLNELRQQEALLEAKLKPVQVAQQKSSMISPWDLMGLKNG